VFTLDFGTFQEELMKAFSRVMIGMGLLLGSGVCAMADIVWTLNDVDFSDGNQAVGYFITDNAVDTIESFSIQVEGPDTSRDFIATTMSSAYLPNEIGAFLEPTYYTDLFPETSMTSSGGIIPLNQGYDCPGCGVLSVGIGYNPTVNGVTETPEPSTIPFLGAGVLLMGVVLRRKLIRAS
jgi:hypothetical protein